MVSGDREVYERCLPYFQVLGSRQTYLGEGEKARQIKILINMLLAQELQALLAIADSMTGRTSVPCTACRYCTTHCPQGLDIPMLLELYNEHVFSGGGFIAPMRVAQLPDGKKPSACVGCRSCEAVCPQQIKISEALADFSAKLGL